MTRINLIKEIQDEMFDFYGRKVNETIVEQFLVEQIDDRKLDDPDWDGNFVFDTTEREDFILFIREMYEQIKNNLPE
jgi:hypothetical protein|tara:strand:+ start:74 stop:304 length:231 start_codon:yes stop_codon:yes gene_type:complete